MDSEMSGFGLSFSSALEAPQAAEELAGRIEAELRGAREIVGGILLSTAAAGSQAHEVGRLLGQRWLGVELVGTSFEGLLADGRVWRDQPALGLLAWQGGEREPVAFAFEPGDHCVLPNTNCVVARRVLRRRLRIGSSARGPAPA